MTARVLHSVRPPAVGVCGFGRCGSTMVMSMLVAGGMTPGNASEPPYEGDLQDLWHLPLDGRVVKLLDSVSYYGIPPASSWRFIWLDRDPIEQAKSHVKFTESILGAPLRDGAVEQFAESYARDRPKVLGLLRRAGGVLVMDYERVLANPRRAAKDLRKVWPELDVDRAAAVVHERDGRCRPDLAVELAISAGPELDYEGPKYATLVDDGSGDPPALVHGDEPLSVEGEAAMVALIRAAKRHQAEQDAADPAGAAERVRRQAASAAKIRERNQRLSGGDAA